MNDGIFFADAELPFHVWVRERRGGQGYRWVLREAHAVGEATAANDAAEAPGDGVEPAAGRKTRR
jgi:hypothetical protein